MIVNSGLKLPIAYDDYDNLMWYHRDAKRIKKRIAWDSGGYQKTKDGKYIIEIKNKNRTSEYWIVDMVRDRTTGRTKVTPIDKAKRLIQMGNNLYLYLLADSIITFKKLSKMVH